MTKMRRKINDIKSRQIIEENNKAKKMLFVKINKIYKSMVRQ